ncbi:C-GCAxxG-C-C family protein [uncultured Duncaniella sp.]|uniref:C-GCAxxG-C-C family protein n=1 Tax=uncultured Duncaniella sp. TaxID=2768039 RepID=UPI00267754E8|nr:C-GCAxxG-C-C family protein [uncultured Duncaniella sp.]MCI9172542.1 C_GCAxxG_C_C family protein [Muribaculaceae bacterium]
MKYTLEERVAKARDLRAQGYNCSQCVVMAFDDVMDVDVNMLVRAAGGFGTGIGASGDICGALTGTTMVLGLVREGVARPALYREVREAISAFEELEGARDCRDLKGAGRKPCLDLILDAVTLLHNRLADA